MREYPLADPLTKDHQVMVSSESNQQRVPEPIDINRVMIPIIDIALKNDKRTLKRQ